MSKKYSDMKTTGAKIGWLLGRLCGISLLILSITIPILLTIKLFTILF